MRDSGMIFGNGPGPVGGWGALKPGESYEFGRGLSLAPESTEFLGKASTSRVPPSRSGWMINGEQSIVDVISPYRSLTPDGKRPIHNECKHLFSPVDLRNPEKSCKHGEVENLPGCEAEIAILDPCCIRSSALLAWPIVVSGKIYARRPTSRRHRQRSFVVRQTRLRCTWKTRCALVMRAPVMSTKSRA